MSDEITIDNPSAPDVRQLLATLEEKQRIVSLL